MSSTELFNKAQLFIEQIFSEIGKSINKSKQIDFIYPQFYSDEFLRAFILRFVFCYATLRLHREYFSDYSFYKKYIKERLKKNVSLKLLFINNRSNNEKFRIKYFNFKRN